MKVLVTGATGFIGSEVVRQLAARGDEVLALLRPGSLPPAGGFPATVRCVSVPLEDAQRLADTIRAASPDVTVHLAWYANPSDYLVSRENLGALRMTTELVRTAIDCGCQRLLVASTCLEYQETGEPHLETDPLDPVSLYASCKAAAWLSCRALARASGASLAWARVFHVHGPNEHPNRLIPAVVRALRRGEPFGLSPGGQVRDHLHVNDVASGIIRTAMSKEFAGPVNICSGTPVTLREVMETIGDLLGRRELLQFGARPYAPNEVMHLAGSSERLRSTGWEPAFVGLRDSLRYVTEPEGSSP